MQYFECKADRSELIIVEGKHAANAVNHVRNKSNQAVLAMQGKVPNLVRTSLQQQIARNDHVRQLTTILESWAHPHESPSHRYSQAVILSDPDADGLHAAMLLICLLAEAFPDLVREQSLLLCRSPLFLLNLSGDKADFAYSEGELARRRQKSGQKLIRAQRFKGIASLPPELLYKTCINPLSRKASILSEADCAAVKQRLS